MTASRILALTLVAMTLATGAAFAQSARSLDIAATGSRVAYVENKGQWDARARFLLRTGGLDTWVTSNGIVYDLNVVTATAEAGRPGSREERNVLSRRGQVVAMSFAGARGDARVVGLDRLPGEVNYFRGNDPSKWATHVGRYSGVRIEKIYDGIDAKLYLDDGRPRYDLIVSPGADPAQASLKFEGATSVSKSPTGSLRIATSVGTIEQAELFCYQEIGGTRREVSSAFTIRSNGTVGFTLGSYDRSKPLVIDPLVYSTFIGTSGDEHGRDIAVDSWGSPYITGYTNSASFPTTTGAYDQSYNGSGENDVFVVKLSNDGSTLEYATYLGGNGAVGDWGRSIAVDGDGFAYVSGETHSANWPTTVGAYDVTHNGVADNFVTKLSQDGSSLEYSTYIGGGLFDDHGGLALDSWGNAYISGLTNSTNFPTTAGAFDLTFGGSFDIFVAKLSDDGSSLVYSTYVGGAQGDFGHDIAVDGAGLAYVSGETVSGNFPTTAGAFDGSYNGNNDGVVFCLNASGSALVYSTYLGGNGFDIAYTIAVDGASNAYVSGRAANNFPTTATSYRPTFVGGIDAYVTKFDAAGTMVYSTYIGGNGNDIGHGIAVDVFGVVYLVGDAEGTFPVTSGAIDETYNGAGDAFVARLSTNGANLLYATYLGGTGNEYAMGIATTDGGWAYVAGATSSSGFPYTSGAYDTAHNGGVDAWAAKLLTTSNSGGVYLVESPTRLIDNRAGYSETIGVDYTGTNGGLQGVQFTINVPNTALVINSVTPGDLVSDPSQWSFNYDVTNAASGSEVRVLLYGRNSGVYLDAGSYPDLFTISYEVDNLALCNGALGGDVTTQLMYVSDVSSSLADGLGTSAGVPAEARRDTASFTIHNSSDRGDVDCNDQVDVLDLNRVNKVARGNQTFDTWQRNRADLAPWSAYWSTEGALFNDANNYGDTKVNVQDVTLLSDAILNGYWPDTQPLAGILPVPTAGSDNSLGFAKGASIYDVKFTALVSSTSVKMRMHNKVAVGAIQIDLKASAPADVTATIDAAYADDFDVRVKSENGRVRMIIYSPSGALIPAGTVDVATLSFGGTADRISFLDPVIAGDANDNPLLVQHEVTTSVSSVGTTAAATGLVEASPNPFTHHIDIRFESTLATNATVRVHDMKGGEVVRLYDGIVPSGATTLRWNGRDASGAMAPAGSYLYTIDIDGKTHSGTIVLVR